MPTERTSRAGDYQLVIDQGYEIETLKEREAAERERADEAERKLKLCQASLTAAVEYEEHAFDWDTDVNGADLVKWFAAWRAGALAALDGETVKLPSPTDAMRDAARLALDALAARNNTGRRNTQRDQRAADALVRAFFTPSSSEAKPS